jgi:hypothetical protein
VPGSVLDFSFLVADGPAGRLGRVTTTRDGHLAFATQPDQPQRFLCASQPLGPYAGGELPPHKEIDAYVRQLRMHGYNMARLPRPEQLLMRKRDRDFDFDPVQLDRFYYLLAALKREGIYWLMYGLTYKRGAYASPKSGNVKLGIYYDPAQQDHWRQLVSRLFGAKNPYTGLRPVDDPALAGIILVNEGGINFMLRKKDAPEELRALFVQWLHDRYGNTPALAKAWGRGAPTGLAAHESLEQGVIEIPRNRNEASARMADLQRFYLSVEQSMLKWMTDHLRKLGYPGLVTAFDTGMTLQAHVSRGQLDWVDMHRYHDYPKGFVKQGAKRKQTSSLASEVQYLRQLAVSRFGGRPYTVSEYGQPFWNTWRRESGLTAPSYASFQNWDMICRMASGPVELAYGRTGGKRKDAIYPYGVGLDPIGRAAETLAALLYLRRDVKPARSRLGVMLTPDYVFEASGGVGQIPRDISNLALVTGVGLLWEPAHKTEPAWQADGFVQPDQTGLRRTASGTPLTIDGDKSGRRWGDRVTLLRKGGILPQHNRTNAARRVYETDTGELLLETRKRRFRVITPKTEGVVFDGGLPLDLSSLGVESADGPALVAVSSLDDRPLNESGRMLLILATDALNSGMRFADDQRRMLLELGTLPAVLRTAKVTIRLLHKRPGRLQLYATGFNGLRRESVPVERTPDGIRFTLNTAALQHGPTTFFELVEEQEVSGIKEAVHTRRVDWQEPLPAVQFAGLVQAV